MATLLVKGNQLEADKIRTPLNRKFLLALAVTFIIAMNFFMPNPGGSGLYPSDLKMLGSATFSLRIK
jgi:O-antigen polymerase